AEFAKHPKGQLIPGYKSLGEICETKTARGDGMLRLYYHLLLDLDIAPKIALVADREERLFNPKLMNPWQLTNVMLAVEELGASPILLNPSARFAPASIIHPDFQGVQGLLLDPKADWASEAFQVPIQPATLNTKGFEYSLVLGEEEDRFQLTAHFKGFPEFAERWRYMINEPAEQNRLLKEHFEKTLKGASIEKTEVLNAVNPKETVSWRVEGTLEPKGGRQRTIEPFPGMPWPLWVPDSFPKERSLPIVMPYLQTQTSRSVIKVPKGFQVRPVRPYQEQNRFGHVSWSMKQSPSGDENLAEVTLEVGLNTMFAGPDGYEDLKVFLGWISDACRRTLIMEKV
ncbi:MAG: hypothetical protein Q8O19_06230, partial [Rectinemataceae bacterium]|nr:hypothetical protein [Rectinemataceae bacterium]